MQNYNVCQTPDVAKQFCRKSCNMCGTTTACVDTNTNCYYQSTFVSSMCASFQVRIYPSPIILTELFQHNLINVSYLTECYLYQVMMTLHFLNDVAYDAESTQKWKITS